MIKLILNDIEGTTTPISFVHDRLFPYAKTHLSEFVRKFADQSDIQQTLLAVNETAQKELGISLNQQGAIELLLKWIDEDRKHTALKDIQGLIWKQGYVTGEIISELYDDVADQMRAWHKDKLQLGVYSSGSVAAQKLLFGHTPAGDLNPLFSFYFDTNVGHKREMESYQTIAEETGLFPEQILFLSDVPQELDAAKSAGMKTIQVVRAGTTPGDRHPTCRTYNEIDALIKEL